ncbi:Integrase family protein [Candidatus Sulfotelmatomonas gaucii]|uniref:Integrase family protein n=1 Tax=Candidatus Sulfuritelmatomonas gaucii TaxID=2043161 RepID=A0A2N9L750_9BACT|nr:Integrase family protein [Candidatus Sulfotelmatomonas gaucii]
MEEYLTVSEVGKGTFPHVIPFPPPPLQFSPMAAYLSRLAPSSRLTMAKLLRRIVALLGSSTAAEAFPWSRLDYATTIQLRQTLASHYAPATANLALCGLRGVLREAWRLGQISFEDFHRAGDLAPVRGEGANPRKSVDIGKIEKLLAVTRSDQTVRGRRDLAILSVLYGAGLRRAELTHLDLAHVEVSRLMVFGKGRQWRTTHLGQDAVTALEGWLLIRGTAPGALFLPIHRSGALRPRRLSTEAVARIVAQRAQAAGVGKLHPHDLRRAFATRLLETGVDVLVVQRILGHRSVTTTQIYDGRLDSAFQAVALP